MPTLSYRRSGPESQCPLVLIHALPLNSHMWDSVRSELADIDLVTPDAPGFGESPAGSEFGEPSISSYAQALYELIQSLGLERLVLGGLSMGGAVCAEFVAQYPHMVAGLALMDTNINADTQAQRENRLRIAAQAEAGNGYSAVQNWSETMLSSEASEQLRTQIDDELRALPDAGLAYQQRAMAGRVDRADSVARVEGPVFLGRGDQDPTCSLEYLMNLALAAHAPRIVEFSPASHFSANEQPLQVASFLRSLYEASVK